jgi:hypothetical protein
MRSSQTDGSQKRADVHATTSRSSRSGAECELHPDRAAEREADERESFRGDEVERAAGEVGHVVELDHRRVAVTGVLEPHDVEVAQGSVPAVPHSGGRTQRAAEDDGAHRR